MGIFKKARGDKNNFGESAIINEASYLQYYDRLQELAVSYFKWINLPDTCNARKLEIDLFCNGSELFFFDDVMGYLNLKWANSGGLDVYEEPINRRAISGNGYQKSCDETNSVIIYNSMIHKNFEYNIKLFAERLYILDRIIDVNVNAQRTPVLVTATENQRLTMLNLYKQYAGNAPFIFGNKGLDVNQMQVLNTQAPFVADKLFELKTRIWNEALTFIGVSNVAYEKKEHLIKDEVQQMQGGVVSSRFSRLAAREEACEKINRLFGLNVSVEARQDITPDLTEEPGIKEENVSRETLSV